jgi:hypothetical protein
MAGIKLVISVVFHLLPLFVPTAMKIGPPTGLSLSARLRHWPLSSHHPTPLVERRPLCHHLFRDRVDIVTVSMPHPSRLVASNLGRYKSSYLRCFSSSTLVHTYCHEDRTTHGFVPINMTPSLTAVIVPSRVAGRTPPSLPQPSFDAS